MKKLLILCILVSSQLALSQNENCLQFNGYSDYVRVGYVNNLGTSDFTLEAWVYLEGSALVSDKIINKGLTTVGTPVNAGYGIRTRRDSPDELEFNVGDVSGNWTSLVYNGITTNTWHHIAGVRRGEYLLLYLDGALVASTACPYVYNVDTNMPLAIGAIDKDGLSTTNEYCHGKIDEVRIWNKARIAGDIYADMNCKMTNQPNLIGLYNLDETSGLVASDVSSGANNGNLSGAPNWIYSPVAQLCPVGVVENESPALNMSVYPNPSAGLVNLSVDHGDYILYNMNGELVSQGLILNGQLEFSSISHGMYILQVSNENGLERVKLILE